MSSARVEELSDSDPEEIDISSIATPAGQPHQAKSTLIDASRVASRAEEAQARERSKHWQCLYPIYFDAGRTREEGRRVSKSLAVQNPLAREIVDAVQALGLYIAFEPGKTHPKDWANPGRVRVLIKENGKAVEAVVKNKRQLYVKVAEYLLQHPTNEKSPMKLRIAGMDPKLEQPRAPAIPRGWKMGTILPLHSPAVSGGGVSENLFSDMMNEMQGRNEEQSSGGKGKKDKKGKS